MTRIRGRDRIAGHGANAIDAISPWVANPKFGAFPVPVIEAMAKSEEDDATFAALLPVYPFFVAQESWRFLRFGHLSGGFARE